MCKSKNIHQINDNFANSILKALLYGQIGWGGGGGDGGGSVMHLLQFAEIHEISFEF